MAHRTFTDALGMEWDVWEVHPQLAERRTRERRGRGAAAQPSRVARDRRLLRDRRRHAVAEVRLRITDGFERGWLVFQSAVEKRRLAPIPPHWDECSETLLGDLCDRATPVGEPRRGRLIE